MQIFNRVGKSVDNPIGFLNDVLETDNIDFLEPYNFMKVMQLLNIAEFKRLGMFHYQLGLDSFEECKKAFLGDVGRELCFICKPANKEVDDYYEKFKRSRDKFCELAKEMRWK